MGVEEDRAKPCIDAFKRARAALIAALWLSAVLMDDDADDKGDAAADDDDDDDDDDDADAAAAANAEDAALGDATDCLKGAGEKAGGLDIKCRCWSCQPRDYLRQAL